jgi:hypothetical protein
MDEPYPGDGDTDGGPRTARNSGQLSLRERRRTMDEWTEERVDAALDQLIGVKPSLSARQGKRKRLVASIALWEHRLLNAPSTAIAKKHHERWDQLQAQLAALDAEIASDGGPTDG